ncbi:MAG: amidase [Deltaproteobacteria bacterium]|nr:amidase [Deltaproteobacteria bacterium]
MIREKKLSPIEVVNAFLQRIEEINPKVNAFCTMTAETAVEEAQRAEQAVMDGEPLGPLHGLPFSIKDLVYTKAVRTMRGSKIYQDYVPDEDAILVTRLKDAGGIMVGKTTTPEFGHKGMTDSLVTGVTRNPWNTDLTPGGSSGGAGAQVAAGMTPLAVGTDGGGSIRIPSSFSGIYGLKPSYGRVPVYPASTLDSLSTAGPMTRTVADAALMLSVMAGPDDADPLSLEAPPADYVGQLTRGIQGLKAAWSPNLWEVPLDEQVADITTRAAQTFEELGATVEETDPGFEDVSRAFGTFWLAGMAGTLGDYLEEWEDRIDPSLVQQVKLGLEMKAVDFVKAQIQRSEFRDQVRRFFKRYDLLLLPTIPILPFKAGVPAEDALKDQPVDPRNWTPFTSPFNLSQNPAATVPAGFSKEGLPVGLQIVGRRFADLTVLQASAAFEALRPWQAERPSL